MKKWKKPLLFTLTLLPVAAVGGWFTVLYQFELYDPAVLEPMIAQVGSMEMVLAISVVQVLGYAAFCGFFGWLLADKVGLLKRARPEKRAVVTMLLLSLVGGILFSLDYWIFGPAMPGIQEGTKAGLTVSGWIASILYGGILEEVILRLFVMSLTAWLLWKLFFRNRETAPEGVLIAANVIGALLFAAGHLPATVIAFGALSPMLLVRCFLYNGGFGLLFGWLYRKYGIGYAMLSHALLHIISKTIWMIFT